MVESVNVNIKKNTVLKYKYENKNPLKKDFRNFLAFYNKYRKHCSLRIDLDVKSSFNPVKSLYKLVFLKKTSFKFENNI